MQSEDQDSYDFFTSALDDSYELSKPTTVPENEDVQPKVSEHFEQCPKRVQQYFTNHCHKQNPLGDEAGLEVAINDELENNAVVDIDSFSVEGLQHPLYTPHQERLNSEEQVYFRPNSILGIDVLLV